MPHSENKQHLQGGGGPRKKNEGKVRKVMHEKVTVVPQIFLNQKDHKIQSSVKPVEP